MKYRLALRVIQLLSRFKNCTEHGSISAVLCANFLNDLTTEMNAMHVHERGFARSRFNMRFGRIIFIAQLHISSK